MTDKITPTKSSPKTSAPPTGAPRVTKTALDAEAAKYWTDYYGESGYGALWVKEIPMKVTAELRRAHNELKKAASVPEVSPVATTITDDLVTLEGLAKSAGRTYMFVADFSHEGELKSFDSLPVNA